MLDRVSMNPRYPLLILSLLALSSIAGASSINATLASYKVPGSIIANLTRVNISYGTAQYAALYLHGNLTFLLNQSNGYSIVLGTNNIANVVQNYTIAQSFLLANFTRLYAEMKSFQHSGAHNISEALQITGLNHYTCTVANSCQACLSVGAYCSTLWYQTLGQPYSIEDDIMAFASNYTRYNDSLNQFYATVNSVTVANASQSIPTLVSDAANVESYAHAMASTGLFPLPFNMSYLLGDCGFYGAGGGPWYCNDLGYAGFWLGFNYTMIRKINTQLSVVSSLPITRQNILSAAASTNATEAYYVLPVISVQRKAQIGQLLNTTLSGYANIVSNSETILLHLQNATLSKKLAALESVYASINSNYLTENMSFAAIEASGAMANLTTTYDSLNKTYSSIVDTAENSTVLLLNAQLDTQSHSQAVAAMEFKELKLNLLISGVIGNSSAILAQAQAINTNASSASRAAATPSLSDLARAVDGPFIGQLGFRAGLPFAVNKAYAPLYGSLLSLIIGVVIFILVYLVYLSLGARKRIIMTQRTRSNWNRLFLLVWVLIIIYVIITYLALAGASGFSPVSAFESSVAHSKYVAVVENGTQTIGGQNCVNALVTEITAMNKKPVLAQINGNTCLVGNMTESSDYCMNFFAYAGVPAVVLTNNDTSSISTYSLYGSQLLESGDSSALGTCYAALLLR